MLPGIEMDVVALDDPKKLLPVGEVGEIRIRGPNVTKGYWNRPQETAEAFVGDRFLTGDIGYMDADGYFYLVDRKKDMIISGGFNVYPQMIEQAIYEHPAVQEVIVIGIPDDYRGEAAKAFVKLRAGARPFTLDELKAFLAGKLGKHEIPAALDFVDDLPRTSVGKLSRHELRNLQQVAAEAAATGIGRPGVMRQPIRSSTTKGNLRIEFNTAHRRIRWISASARKKWRFVTKCGRSSGIMCRPRPGRNCRRAVISASRT